MDCKDQKCYFRLLSQQNRQLLFICENWWWTSKKTLAKPAWLCYNLSCGFRWTHSMRKRGESAWKKRSIPSMASPSSVAYAVRRLRRVPWRASWRLKFAPSATPSSPASRSWLIPADALTASRSVSTWNKPFKRAPVKALFLILPFGRQKALRHFRQVGFPVSRKPLCGI